ncbi:MAG: VOC family protein [Bacteroidota bacterium]
MQAPFAIKFLDHVAIRVLDLERSAQWYETVLGLTRFQTDHWGPFPIFMFAGKTGVALFPADPEAPRLTRAQKGVKIDHFAFQVSRTAFEAAQAHFTRLGIPFVLKDHHFYLACFIEDPDGHQIELNTLTLAEEEFYTWL